MSVLSGMWSLFCMFTDGSTAMFKLLYMIHKHKSRIFHLIKNYISDLMFCFFVHELHCETHYNACIAV